MSTATGPVSRTCAVCRCPRRVIGMTAGGTRWALCPRCDGPALALRNRVHGHDPDGIPVQGEAPLEECVLGIHAPGLCQCPGTLEETPR